MTGVESKIAMVPRGIGDMVDVSDPRLSPDGERATVTVTSVDLEDNVYRSAVWVVDVDGSGVPRPLTNGDDRDGRARWSPDGSHISFTSHRQEKGCELYVLALEGGEARQVASSPEEIDEVAWSPDGARLAFTTRTRDEVAARRYDSERVADRPARRLTKLYGRLEGTGWVHDRPKHVFVVPTDGSAEAIDVTPGEFEVAWPSWRPDGQVIVATSAQHDDRDLRRAVDLVVIDPDTPGPVKVLTATDAMLAHPSWSPDGTAVACHYREPLSDPRDLQVAVIPVDDTTAGQASVLTLALDRQCAPHTNLRGLAWSDGWIWFTFEDGGDVRLSRVPSAGGEVEVVVGGGRWVTGFDVVDDRVVVTATSPTSPAELFSIASGGEASEDGKGLQRLTTFTDTFCSLRSFTEPIAFTAMSSGGAEVHAWFIPPAGVAAGEQRPAVLNIHGGPYTQYGNRFFDEFQLQSAAGYGVIYSNPRGSSGYGEAWGRAIRGPMAEVDPGSGWGGVDTQDLLAVVDEAVRRFPVIDADRLGVMGGSYGGYMTSWLIGHDTRFRCAISERAVNNVFTLEGTSDIASVFSRQHGVTHIEHPEEYARISPITYVRNIQTPVLILHSEDDWRCPIEQAEQLFVALRMLGRDVEFVRFPGEGHELSRSGAPAHRVERAEIVLEWLQRWFSE